MKIVVVAVLLALASQCDAGPCATFSKGSFSGGVKSKSECRSACEKAEGLTKEYNGVLEEYKDCSKVDGNITLSGGSCSCKSAKDSSRSVCSDDACDGATGLVPSLLLGFLMVTTAMYQTQ